MRIVPALSEVIEQWEQDEFRSVHAHFKFLLREAANVKNDYKKKKRADLLTQPSCFEEIGKSKLTVVPFPSSL
nr:hypothetical protein [Parageobacillus thermoglucosidasius]